LQFADMTIGKRDLDKEIGASASPYSQDPFDPT
jgi:hypothetical protein